MDDVITRLIDLPYEQWGMIMLDDNGDYNVYLNARMPQNIREDAYCHELAHMKMNHFYRDIPVTLAEEEAEEYKATIRREINA